MPRLRGVFGGSAILTIARLGGAGAGFVTQLILARLLGPTQLGIFYAATSIAVVAAVCAAGGYPGITQRFLTRYGDEQRQAHAQAFVTQIQIDTLITTVLICSILAAIFVLWPTSPDTRNALLAGVLVIPAMASLNIYAALANVERRFAAALLPEIFVRPLAFLHAVTALAVTGPLLSAGIVTFLYAGLTWLIAGAQYVLVSPKLPSWSSKGTRIGRRWRNEAWPLVVVILFTTSFADLAIFLVAPFLPSEDVAAFGICMKLAILVGFAVQVSQQVALPDLAEAHERGDVAANRRALIKASLFPTVITLVATVLAVFWGDLLLGLFAPEFARATWVLALLVGAQFIRAVAGPSVLMLTLTGAQHLNAGICLACCAALFAANALLVPQLGLIGAALAVVVTYAAWIVITAALLRKRSDIRTDLAFSVLPR